MRKEEALITLFRKLTDLIADEAACNVKFAKNLENILIELPEKNVVLKKTSSKTAKESLPDLHAEWKKREELDFRIWLKDLPIPVLRGIIRQEDFDANRRTSKWNEAEKIADFIADTLQARQLRGAAFMAKRDD
jgi:hypothetical protein